MRLGSVCSGSVSLRLCLAFRSGSGTLRCGRKGVHKLVEEAESSITKSTKRLDGNALAEGDIEEDIADVEEELQEEAGGNTAGFTEQEMQQAIAEKAANASESDEDEGEVEDSECQDSDEDDENDSTDLGCAQTQTQNANANAHAKAANANSNAMQCSRRPLKRAAANANANANATKS